MKQDLFKYLPSEITSDILLRLPLESIATSKCVCKAWRNLIGSDDFVKSHLSKSAPGLAVSMPGTDSNWFNVFHLKRRDPITRFDFPQASTIEGCANGLLLLKNPFIDHLYVCNPITREFVELRGPRSRPRGDCYGFGVSKITGQHKVVYLNPRYGCHVYTLESAGSWRSVEATSLLFDRCYGSVGAFVNGNLHWLVATNEHPYKQYICCFDVETECLSTISVPVIRRGFCAKLYSLGDCLCFCDEEIVTYDNVIWLLEERCWREVVVIIPYPSYYDIIDVYKRPQPIKVYRNGDVLILWDEEFFVYYSNKRKTSRKVGWFGELGDDSYYINSTLTPSFLTPKKFPNGQCNLILV